ncbi:MAG: hypothetical protein P1V29_01405 [Gammaproteobacteria bacterium]|nr:hypothetical protein [Gammaproteobacteria bacterium]
MRNVVLALLVANALFFAWQHFASEAPASVPRDDGPARALLNTGLTLRSELIP